MNKNIKFGLIIAATDSARVGCMLCHSTGAPRTLVN